MKTIKLLAIALMLSLTTISCEKEELDCECDRVVQVNHFTVGNYGSYGSFVTVNDCSGLQQTWAISNYGVPRVGDCR